MAGATSDCAELLALLKAPTCTDCHAYDVSGRPNSWASPDGARTFSLVFLFFMLLVFTAVGYLVAHSRPDRAKPAVILLFIAMGLVFVFMNGFVWFNLVG